MSLCLTVEQRRDIAMGELLPAHCAEWDDDNWDTAQRRQWIEQWISCAGPYAGCQSSSDVCSAVALVSSICLDSPLSCVTLVSRLFVGVAKIQKTNPRLRLHGADFRRSLYAHLRPARFKRWAALHFEDCGGDDRVDPDDLSPVPFSFFGVKCGLWMGGAWRASS